MEKQVHPKYLTTPLNELIAEFGHEWLAEQNRIFNEILEESKCNILV